MTVTGLLQALRILLKGAGVILGLLVVWVFYTQIAPMVWRELRYGPARERFAECRRNETGLGRALLSFRDANKRFPSASTAGAAAKPPISWRVAILPFLMLGDREIVSTYRFNETWNGPYNSTLQKVDLWYYHCPADVGPATNTSYVSVIGHDTAFPGTGAITASDIKGGAANTILIVETTASGIHWMEPKDLPLKEALRGIAAHPGPSISSRHFQEGGANSDGAHAVFADGRVKWLNAAIDAKGLEKLLKINGPKPSELE